MPKPMPTNIQDVAVNPEHGARQGDAPPLKMDNAWVEAMTQRLIRANKIMSEVMSKAKGAADVAADGLVRQRGTGQRNVDAGTSYPAETLETPITDCQEHFQEGKVPTCDPDGLPEGIVHLNVDDGALQSTADSLEEPLTESQEHSHADEVPTFRPDRLPAGEEPTLLAYDSQIEADGGALQCPADISIAVDSFGQQEPNYVDTAQAFDTSQVPKDVTTLMLHDLPCGITPTDLMETIDSLGFTDAYDFVYMPWRGTSNCAYAFVNFVSHATAVDFGFRFQNHRFPNSSSLKVCSVKPARIQGKKANYKRYKRSRDVVTYPPFVRW